MTDIAVLNKPIVKLGSLKKNVAKETEGDWQDIPDVPGLRLRCRGFHYGPYQIAKSLVEAKWTRKFIAKGVPVPPKVHFQVNGELYAEHILLEWDGLDVPYSKAKALEVLTNPEFRDFHEWIKFAGTMIAETDVEFAGETEKN